MTTRRLPSILLVLSLLATPALSAGETGTPKPPAKISWKKTVVDAKFRSEGVAVADVNKDGKPDILVGDFWYEAPSWKPHEIRKPGNFGDGAGGYSQSFACWTDDLNNDGWPDLVVVGFPGAPCHWYENPQGKDGHWKEHFICKSACNETPQYLDLFGKGKRVLIMGYEKQMIWLRPAEDPAKPWEIHPISEPGKQAPGTDRFAHGLGIGDINGDGRQDVLCTAGWWEQPETVSDAAWKFHAGDLGPACADMYAVDIDGDGKNDVVSSAAHDYGFWVQLQRPGKESPSFVSQPLFPTPAALTRGSEANKLAQEEQALYAAVNKLRGDQRKAPFAVSAELCRMARAHAEKLAGSGAAEANIAGKYEGRVVIVLSQLAGNKDLAELVKELLPDAVKDRDLVLPGFEIGVGYASGSAARYTLIIGNPGRFSLPSQTHALHHADIDGDGVKDFVTGRRFWAHGPKGDPGSGDPAYLYWFQGKRDSKGALSFTPHAIDDDSGVGTQFALADINGDGLLDVILSNKRGVFVIEQVRGAAVATPPGKKE